MSEKLSVKGILKEVLTVEAGTSKAGKEWQKQNFVIDNGQQYNPEVCFQVFGEDKIKMLSKFAVGQNIEVLFNISSREFNGKYYHNIDAWAINEVKQDTNNKASEESDDLPF